MAAAVRIALGLLATLVLAAAVIAVTRRGRRPGVGPGRVLLGTVLLLGTVVAVGLGGNASVHWIEYHEGLALVGSLLLIVAAVLVPLVVIRPAAVPGAEPDSTTRSPSPSARSPETP